METHEKILAPHSNSFALTACTQTEAASTPTNTPVPLTTTNSSEPPTVTSTPIPPTATVVPNEVVGSYVDIIFEEVGASGIAPGFVVLKAESAGGVINTDIVAAEGMARVVADYDTLSVVDIDLNYVLLPSISQGIQAVVDGNLVKLPFQGIEDGFAIYSNGTVTQKDIVQIPRNDDFYFYKVVDLSENGKGQVFIVQLEKNTGDIKLFSSVTDKDVEVQFSQTKDGLIVRNDGIKYEYNIETGQMQEVDEVVGEWRYVAPTEQFGGDDVYRAVQEFLANPENIPTQDQITRIVTSEGVLPYGHVFTDEVRYNSDGGENWIHSYILGGLVPIGGDWGVGDASALIMFHPDDPNNIGAGGKILTFWVNDYLQSGLVQGINILKDGGDIYGLNTLNWEYTEKYVATEPGLLDILQYGLVKTRSLFGVQIVFGVQHFPDGYSSTGGAIVENVTDRNGDGVSDDGNGNMSDVLTIHPGYNIGIPETAVGGDVLSAIQGVSN